MIQTLNSKTKPLPSVSLRFYLTLSYCHSKQYFIRLDHYVLRIIGHVSIDFYLLRDEYTIQDYQGKRP